LALPSRIFAPEKLRGAVRNGQSFDLKKGQRIRVRAVKAAQDWGVSVGAEGVVLCHYSIFARGRESERCVDVHFKPGLVVWGAPVMAFEEVGEPHPELVGA
jgi:hypothetical protein